MVKGKTTPKKKSLNPPKKAPIMKEKKFKCTYDGCGKAYSTAKSFGNHRSAMAKVGQDHKHEIKPGPK